MAGPRVCPVPLKKSIDSPAEKPTGLGIWFLSHLPVQEHLDEATERLGRFLGLELEPVVAHVLNTAQLPEQRIGAESGPQRD
jgi:hypothetical protein